MTVHELRLLSEQLVSSDGSEYLLVIVDEDDEVYTITDITVDHARKALILHTNTTPLDMR
jgi:hypothetical protein